MRLIIINIFLFVILSGCSSNNSNTSLHAQLIDSLKIQNNIQKLENLTIFSSKPKSLLSIQFRKEQEFSEIYPALLPPNTGFGPKTAVDYNGNVYLVNNGRKTIHVYKPDGSLLTDIGREGKGPGEFMVISAIYIHNNRLVVYDSNLIRIQIFTLKSLELSKTTIIDSQQWSKFDEVRISNPATILCLSDSTFLAGVLLNDRNDRSYYGYYILDNEGKIISKKIIEQQQHLIHQGTLDNDRTIYIQLPFTSEGILDVAQDGTIYHTNTKEALIKIYNSKGDFHRAFYYMYHKEPLEVEDALALFHPNVHPAIKNANFPKFWPAIKSMKIDDKNRIWISTNIADKKFNEWWVLKETGEVITKFKWSSSESIVEIKNGYMYIRETEETTGLQTIVKYRIEIK